ncbi:hypothetical protein AAFF_G00087480 [Aldrovandia affinis]|uniref:Uncharacterized protein n=1 Tax=Aldrovandia affinis TaxID=143900 RepID=A0AAD7RWK9_9TELE|nr:hypothetical protein AAFF_G00087480 [Aldrovandia affinis]
MGGERQVLPRGAGCSNKLALSSLQIDDYVRRLEEAEKNSRIAKAKIAERDQRISEVETLRAKVAQKDLFITDLLDRIAIVECENNGLGDKLKYFVSVQSGSSSRATTQTRDVGVGCDLPLRPEAAPDTEAPPRPAQWSPVRHSRMDSSILKYSPTQYSMMLQHSRAPPAYSPASPPAGAGPAQRGSPSRYRPPRPQSRTVRSSGPDQSTGEFRRIEDLHALHETHGDYFKDYN